MNPQDVVLKVNEIMRTDFEVTPDRLKPEASLFEDLGLDSLDAIDLVVRLEESTGLKVVSEKFQNIRTLGEVYELVAGMTADVRPRTESPGLKPQP
jgi:acyl carrier protein